MNKKLKNTSYALAAIATITGVLATAYAVKKRKPISRVVKNDLTKLVENIKDVSAYNFHTKIGDPIYRFIKKKENIPY
jgi:ribosomal protein S12